MKQYRRSRPEASREGVRRAKALLEGDKESTGRRVLQTRGGIPSHPLLRFVEIEKIKATFGQPSDSLKRHEDMAKKRMADLKKREDFLRAMANFRPKETVFEAFGSGGGKDHVFNSQVDKCTNGNSAALVAMKSMRRQMTMARHKGSLVIAGSKTAQIMNGEVTEDGDVELEMMVEEEEHLENNGAPGKPSAVDTASSNAECKRRLSKAERKKMKKDPNYKPSVASEKDAVSNVTTTTMSSSSKKAKAKRGSDFRDNDNFIENDFTTDTAAAARDRQIEAAMQPSAAGNSKSSTTLAYRIEENMLDIVGDENVDLVKRQRMMRWDKSKRKYIQTTVGEELSGDSKSKKMRLESGQLVKSDKVKLGELYEKWQKRTNRSIGRVGVFDDMTEDTDPTDHNTTWKKGQKSGNNNKKGKVDPDERKSAAAIRKEREAKENMRIKNMKKGDRRQLERKQHEEKIAAENSRKKGSQGKKGASGRWKGQQKKGKR